MRSGYFATACLVMRPIACGYGGDCCQECGEEIISRRRRRDLTSQVAALTASPESWPNSNAPVHFRQLPARDRGTARATSAQVAIPSSRCGEECARPDR